MNATTIVLLAILMIGAALLIIILTYISHRSNTGVGAIEGEFWRHVDDFGWTANLDDRLTDGDLGIAAAKLAMPPDLRGMISPHVLTSRDLRLDCPEHGVKRGYRGDLIAAGALIAREIDRIDRAEALAQERAGA